MDDSTPSNDPIVYDEETGTYTAPVEAWPVVAASMAVVTFVAAIEEVDPPALSPLFDVVDPDALDSVYESVTTNSPDGKVVFRYEGYEITLSGDETISARPVDDAPDRPADR